MTFIKHIPPPEDTRCRSREHNPPSMIVLPAGVHIWQCEDCGQQQTIRIGEVSL